MSLESKGLVKVHHDEAPECFRALLGTAQDTRTAVLPRHDTEYLEHMLNINRLDSLFGIVRYDLAPRKRHSPALVSISEVNCPNIQGDSEGARGGEVVPHPLAVKRWARYCSNIYLRVEFLLQSTMKPERLAKAFLV